MAIQFRAPESHDLKPRIAVIGVGGAGGNAVNNMIDKQLEGAEFVVANTDSQALQQSRAPRRIQLGAAVTQGLGAGAQPEIGAGAAEESRDEIAEALSGCNMAFITAGMGGGTGTGAGPVIAQIARDLGILTVGVVTKPFSFEGARRMKIAEAGIDELTQFVDTLIIIPNQNLFRVADERTTFAEAFVMADDVLYQGVKGVTDLMVRPGMVNLDFADVRAVMNEMGKAMMGSGDAAGEPVTGGRALEAAEKAIANPLLDDISLEGARGVLINITGGYDLTLFEVDEAANRIRNEADPDANVIFGSALDPEMDGRVRVSVVATGIDADTLYEVVEDPQPEPRSPRRDQRDPQSKRRFGVDPVDGHLRRARSASRAESARVGSAGGAAAVATLRGLGGERTFGEDEADGAPQAYRAREGQGRPAAEAPGLPDAVAPAAVEAEQSPRPAAEPPAQDESPQAPAPAGDEPEFSAEPRAVAAPPEPSLGAGIGEAAVADEPQIAASPRVADEATEPAQDVDAAAQPRDRADPPMGALSQMVRKIADTEPRAAAAGAESARVQIPSFLRR